MTSPTVELCSSESSLSEDAAQEMTARGTAVQEGNSAQELAARGAAETTVRDRNSGCKSEAARSPPTTPEPKSKGSHGKKSVSLKTGGATWAEEGAAEQPSSGRKKRARATPAEDLESNGRKSVRYRLLVLLLWILLLLHRSLLLWID